MPLIIFETTFLEIMGTLNTCCRGKDAIPYVNTMRYGEKSNRLIDDTHKKMEDSINTDETVANTTNKESEFDSLISPKDQSMNDMTKDLVFGYISQLTRLFDENYRNNIINKYKFEIYDICLSYYIYQQKLQQPQWFLHQFDDDINGLLSDLSSFMKTLPQKSRAHIWSHSVRIKLQNKSKLVLDNTSCIKHINALLADCLIVYIKYLCRDQTALKAKPTQQYLKNIAIYIYDKYHPLNKYQFERNMYYFSSMINQYIKVENIYIHYIFFLFLPTETNTFSHRNWIKHG